MELQWLIGSALMWILMLILGIVWVILPFAVFGIKRRLDSMNKNLAEIAELLKESGADSRQPPENDH
ncbi:MAG: hypothetical protein WD035_10290 [Balneolaceae bacterium]